MPRLIAVDLLPCRNAAVAPIGHVAARDAFALANSPRDVSCTQREANADVLGEARLRLTLLFEAYAIGVAKSCRPHGIYGH